MAIDNMMMMRMWTMTIPGASSAVVRPDGKTLYVASSSGSISIIKTSNAQLMHTISLGKTNGSPMLLLSSDGSKLYAVYTQANGGNVLSILSTATRKITQTISLGGAASAAFIALSPNGKVGYVALTSQSQIAMVDLVGNKMLGTASLGTGVDPTGIAVHPNGMTAYLPSSNGVVVFDLVSNTVAGTIAVSGIPQKVGFTADGSMAFVSVKQGQAAVIDTAIDSVIQRLAVTNTVGLTIF